MAPVGDGALNLLQQVKAGHRGSWEEEGGEGRKGERDNAVGLRKNKRNHSSSLILVPVESQEKLQQKKKKSDPGPGLPTPETILLRPLAPRR
ncbi:hypothetical protein NQZ68_005024 [Dissostichus eleginoides]|nr:hypothetical protein NQZ68_005024 [Dissostichus eleginoides]